MNDVRITPTQVLLGGIDLAALSYIAKDGVHVVHRGEDDINSLIVEFYVGEIQLEGDAL
ncbi:hypothetical protein [Mycobacterium sp. Root265]|uniref:hypothetical protein n=1 Tax=Mycobacterium sp. Root265 TaxID=1736504 RepID=UPI000A53A0AF|nr:hypothetical protein [Mycobacterium sp. Root265]